jgi:hypothetical protein
MESALVGISATEGSGEAHFGRRLKGAIPDRGLHHPVDQASAPATGQPGAGWFARDHGANGVSKSGHSHGLSPESAEELAASATVKSTVRKSTIMSTETSKNDSDSLGELLKSWKVEASLPPQFRDRVWRRIARAEEKSAWPISAWLPRLAEVAASLLRRPLGATAYVSTLLVVGSMAGVWRSDHYANRTEAAWRMAYLQAVTPTPSPPSQP